MLLLDCANIAEHGPRLYLQTRIGFRVKILKKKELQVEFSVKAHKKYRNNK